MEFNITVEMLKSGQFHFLTLCGKPTHDHWNKPMWKKQNEMEGKSTKAVPRIHPCNKVSKTLNLKSEKTDIIKL
jgi:hypothetical protein